MAWERGYYYQAEKIGGRVVKTYVGHGRIGELAAQLDAIEREKRASEKASFKTWKKHLADLDEPLDRLNDLADMLARAALIAAGFHQHRRGEWRRRRNAKREAGKRTKNTRAS
jgi:hypothetical protein